MTAEIQSQDPEHSYATRVPLTRNANFTTLLIINLQLLRASYCLGQKVFAPRSSLQLPERMKNLKDFCGNIVSKCLQALACYLLSVVIVIPCRCYLSLPLLVALSLSILKYFFYSLLWKTLFSCDFAPRAGWIHAQGRHLVCCWHCNWKPLAHWFVILLGAEQSTMQKASRLVSIFWVLVFTFSIMSNRHHCWM